LLVKDGLGSTIIDLGREMNGTWYEWSVHRAPSSRPDAYIRAWRQIVTTMRSVPGQHFEFVDSVRDRYVGRRSWPGSATLTTSEPISSTGTAALSARTRIPHPARSHEESGGKSPTAPGGLNWMAAFSRATGKPIIIPEWGLDFHTFGGQDDRCSSRT
jgi:hypothetical protein